MVGASATGNIKLYQLLIGACMLCTIPVAYIALKFGAEPQSVFWSLLLTTLTAQAVRMLLCRRLFSFSVRDFIQKVISPILKVGVLCFVPLLLLRPYYVCQNGMNAILVCIALDVWVAVCIFVFGINRPERDFILRKLRIR
jgi:hypothetical protein